jgi:hypothetical protein
VSLEKTAHEDRAAAAAGANIHEVAPDLLSADRFETSRQVIEANAAKLGVGKRLPSASRADLSTRQLAGMPLILELAERPGHVSDRVCQLLDVWGSSSIDVLKKVLDAQLVLQVVLVQERVTEQIEIAASRPRSAVVR